MKYLKHFFYNSFIWERRSFLVFNCITILSLILAERLPEIGAKIVIFLIYLLFLYSMFSTSKSYSIGNSQNQLGNAFSSKYLLTLPISRKQLLSNLIISNIFSIVPILVVLFWIKLRWENNDKLLIDSTRLITEHFGYVLAVSLFLLAGNAIVQLRFGIEFPRRMYSKGTYKSYLLGFNKLLTYVAYFSLSVFFLFVSLQLKMFWIFLLFMGLVCIFELFKTYNALVDESRSYWTWSRGRVEYVVKLAIVGLAFFGTLYLGETSLKFSSDSWENSYAEGETIFESVSKGNKDEIQNYIDNNGRLDLINKKGVGLIHAFSTLDFSQYNGIESYFLKNSQLLLSKMHVKDKKCNSPCYCEGITPFHLLALKGNSKTLEKALMISSEGKDVLNSLGESPLHYASKRCKYEATKVLIEAQSGLNVLSSNSMSPLMEATKKNCIGSMLLLVKAGADTELKNKEGKVAAELLQSKNNRELSYLMEAFKKN